jgi:hypothetical protein
MPQVYPDGLPDRILRCKAESGTCIAPAVEALTRWGKIGKPYGWLEYPGEKEE